MCVSWCSMAYTYAYEYPFCKLSRDRLIRYIHYGRLVHLGWSLWDNMGVCTLGYLIFNGSRQCVSNSLSGLWCQGYGQKLKCCIYTCNILTKLLIMSSYYVGLILQNYVSTQLHMLIWRWCCLQVQLGCLYLIIINWTVDSPPVYHLRQQEIQNQEGIKSSLHGGVHASMPIELLIHRKSSPHPPRRPTVTLHCKSVIER
jgi:hypothetical protein